ncbi:hypothetical protein E2C01_090489 [Portunus trituberculatus]|uniref:Uncharacterized protein n=1 Tax=Portunus trituberculatus TaxID=210409 RepID=A0A5B7JLX5_PORTR|nr:hypothetical protein [Portunus trituberculatus]
MRGKKNNKNLLLPDVVAPLSPSGDSSSETGTAGAGWTDMVAPASLEQPNVDPMAGYELARGVMLKFLFCLLKPPLKHRCH